MFPKDTFNITLTRILLYNILHKKSDIKVFNNYQYSNRSMVMIKYTDTYISEHEEYIWCTLFKEPQYIGISRTNDVRGCHICYVYYIVFGYLEIIKHNNLFMCYADHLIFSDTNKYCLKYKDELDKFKTDSYMSCVNNISPILIQARKHDWVYSNIKHVMENISII